MSLKPCVFQLQLGFNTWLIFHCLVTPHGYINLLHAYKKISAHHIRSVKFEASKSEVGHSFVSYYIPVECRVCAFRLRTNQRERANFHLNNITYWLSNKQFRRLHLQGNASVKRYNFSTHINNFI
jgi:hypothetical protein